MVLNADKNDFVVKFAHLTNFTTKPQDSFKVMKYKPGV